MNTILLIQSIYRGNKIRNKINYLILLPDEIQRIIINYCRNDFKYKKYKKTLNKIIYKKILNIIYTEGYFNILLDYIEYNNYCDLIYLFNDNIEDIEGINNYINKLINIYYLLNKYYKILEFHNKLHIYNYYYILAKSYHLFNNIKLNNVMKEYIKKYNYLFIFI